MMYTSNTIIFHGRFCKKAATLYKDPNITTKAFILYFHGGGLLYGSRCDLPEVHLAQFTSAGFPVIAFDYPLAPACDLSEILPDVTDSINAFLTEPALFIDSGAQLPYFRFGRSSGAYLVLKRAPLGIWSYYGYGFLEDLWYETPSNYYQTLPAVPETILNDLPQSVHTEGPLATHYSAYVYARQSGKWKSLFYHGREKYFLLYDSLRLCKELPCPVFCTHSTGDTDVPFAEFQKLAEKYSARRFIASGSQHDFDRDTESAQAQLLLKETIAFLNTLIS